MYHLLLIYPYQTFGENCIVRIKSSLSSGEELIIWNNVCWNDLMSVSGGHFIVLVDINSK